MVFIFILLKWIISFIKETLQIKASATLDFHHQKDTVKLKRESAVTK